ncbi:neuronal acetylcholine receptor subunit alpha-10 [Elysia marginata]|uniref:Neuronal acetylcholine receptor subunit alpha-10 n=1 Tax=Elysia marginata TaxID=1093978 RepID=A0AAV4EPA1_9GAST|nr:neuronal acetylcholine receptor subunit alpha-10 [Elysia marginata]
MYPFYRSDKVDLDNYVFSGEWELIGVNIRRQVIHYACCQEPYPDVRFTIVIRRKTLYYLFNIIFPCLWLTILSLLGFWLPPDSGEKITLGITVLLAFSVFMLLIAESMPATSEFVPLIGIYLTVTMGMTSLSIILTVFVLQLHHVGPHKRPVPDWLRTLVCNVFARAVCMSKDSHPFSRRHHYEQQMKRYHMEGKGVGGNSEHHAPKERRLSPHPRVVVEPCDSNPVTQLHRDIDGHGDLQAGNAPPYDSYRSNVSDGNGGFSSTRIANTDNTKLLFVNTKPSISPGSEQTATVPSAVRKFSDSALMKPPNQGGSSITYSSRSRNCNGEAFLHQRDRIAPVNVAELGQTSLDISEPSSRQGGGLQCREYTFHEPDSLAHGYDQVGGLGFSGRISRSPSFRSRSSSFRGDNYRASFRSAYPVVRDGGSGLESPIAAGGGGVYLGGTYADSSYDAYQQLVMEWQFIAHVMDRLLFWLFLFVALISSIAILVIKPMFKPPIE